MKKKTTAGITFGTMQPITITGQLVDVHTRTIYGAKVTIEDGKIVTVEQTETADSHYLLPGFVDAHIHIESSMVLPAAFARTAVQHGTVATVSDPHEIANVCGLAGVQYMIDNSKQTPFKIFFGAPSCVPATGFETAGATLDAKVVGELMTSPDIWYLSEMMNYPGVLHNDPEVMAKIAAAVACGKPVDGHAPGLKGEQAAQYAAAGITTDHECFTLEEALDKVACGMKIIIREGSAARNYEALHPLLALHPDKVMFCSDDKHPDELVTGHINKLVQRSLAKGYELFDVLQAATVNAVEHYRIPVGLLRVGDPADLIVADSLAQLNVLQTWIGGQLVFNEGASLMPVVAATPINQFHAEYVHEDALQVAATGARHRIRVIDAIEGQLVTRSEVVDALVNNGLIVSDTDRDILKIVVVNRYVPHTQPAVAFIRNFGLKRGAIASTIAHDCHNIIAVGVDDTAICSAINALVDAGGGISVSGAAMDTAVLELPVAGLMSLESTDKVAAAYTHIDSLAKQLGTPLRAPFMTLSFMALLVIPSLKLSDKGLFDGEQFAFTDVVVD